MKTVEIDFKQLEDLCYKKAEFLPSFIFLVEKLCNSLKTDLKRLYPHLDTSIKAKI